MACMYTRLKLKHIPIVHIWFLLARTLLAPLLNLHGYLLEWRIAPPEVTASAAAAVTFGGGFAQLYIGVHLTTDIIAGYLVGASPACCTIGVLLRNEPRSMKKQPLETTPSTLTLRYSSLIP